MLMLVGVFISTPSPTFALRSFFFIHEVAGKAWIERKEREQQKESGATGKSVGIERVIVSGGKSLPPPRQNAQTGSSSDIQAWSPNIAMTTPFYCPRFMKEIESIFKRATAMGIWVATLAPSKWRSHTSTSHQRQVSSNLQTTGVLSLVATTLHHHPAPPPALQNRAKRADLRLYQWLETSLGCWLPVLSPNKFKFTSQGMKNRAEQSPPAFVLSQHLRRKIYVNEPREINRKLKCMHLENNAFKGNMFWGW